MTVKLFQRGEVNTQEGKMTSGGVMVGAGRGESSGCFRLLVEDGHDGQWEKSKLAEELWRVSSGVSTYCNVLIMRWVAERRTWAGSEKCESDGSEKRRREISVIISILRGVGKQNSRHLRRLIGDFGMSVKPKKKHLHSEESIMREKSVTRFRLEKQLIILRPFCVFLRH